MSNANPFILAEFRILLSKNCMAYVPNIAILLFFIIVIYPTEWIWQYGLISD